MITEEPSLSYDPTRQLHPVAWLNRGVEAILHDAGLMTAPGQWKRIPWRHKMPLDRLEWKLKALAAAEYWQRWPEVAAEARAKGYDNPGMYGDDDPSPPQPTSGDVLRVGKADSLRIINLLADHAKQGGGCYANLLGMKWTLENDPNATVTIDDVETRDRPEDEVEDSVSGISELACHGNHKFAKGTIWIRYYTYHENTPPKAFWWRWKRDEPCATLNTASGKESV